jgi:hypothetical protein
MMVRNWSMSFRHDTDWRNFSYGFNFSDRGNSYFIDPNADEYHDRRRVLQAQF